jgi:hypothetical protein
MQTKYSLHTICLNLLKGNALSDQTILGYSDNLNYKGCASKIINYLLIYSLYSLLFLGDIS